MQERFHYAKAYPDAMKAMLAPQRAVTSDRSSPAVDRAS